jgi:hypothetical protein
MVAHPDFEVEWGRHLSENHIPTLSDYPLLVGEILRRHDLRSLRRAKRIAFLQKMGRAIGIQNRRARRPR